MLKVIAALFLIAGSSGVGISIIRDEKQRISSLKEMKGIMLLMSNEVEYGKCTFPEICQLMEKKTKGIFRLFFHEVNKEMQKQEGESFYNIWKSCGYILEKNRYLQKKDRKEFIEFPTDAIYQDSQMQEREMKDKQEKLQSSIEKSEKNLETNTKVYLSIGVMSGIFLCILFW